MLGALEVRADGRRLEIGAAKQRALLGLLLLGANRPLPPDRLIDQLWQGSPPRTARTTLQSCVYRLRKLIRPDDGEIGLRTHPAGYLLEVPGQAVDLRRFEDLLLTGREARAAGQPELAASRLRAGLELWHGPALADIELPAVRDEADRLDGMRLEAAELWLAAELEIGRHELVVAELETFTEHNPLRERMWELLMSAYYRSGRPGEALAAYQRIYRTLADELGIEPGRGLRTLNERILTADPALDRRDEVAVKVPGAAVPVPRQLPLGVAELTGREHELSCLDALLSGRVLPRSIVTVCGPAGIGKTTLAVHWAAGAADQFPDGQLYIDLRGFDSAAPPTEPVKVLREFLVALGVPAEQIPAEFEAQASLYRSTLSDRRILIVLDNARDAAQVRPLLPAGRGCLVVVTSRSALTSLVVSYGAQPLELELLTPQAARQLLTERIGWHRARAEPLAVDRIVALCAGLPLALAIVAARAATHPSFLLQDLADELQSAEGRLNGLSGMDAPADIRHTFSWSYRLLGAEAARLFRLLSLWPGAVASIPAAASLVGWPADKVRQLLAELSAVNLLIEFTPGRFGFHDLLRAYAVELCTGLDSVTERRAARQRAFEELVHSAHAAAMILNPQRDPMPLGETLPTEAQEVPADHRAALAWFDINQSTLVTAVGQAAAAGLDRQAFQLAWTMVEYLDRQGQWHDLAGVAVQALRCTERTADRGGQAFAHHILGGVYIRHHRDREARTHLDRAYGIYRHTGDRIGQAATHRTMCWVHQQQGKHAEALVHAEQALDLYTAAGHRTGRAALLNEVGWQQAHLGRYEQGMVHCRQAIELFVELGNLTGQAATWESLGYCHQHLGGHAAALDCYQHALRLYRDLGIRYYEAETLDNTGDTHLAAGDAAAAAAAWRSALEILQDLRHEDAVRLRAKLRTAR